MNKWKKKEKKAGLKNSGPLKNELPLKEDVSSNSSLVLKILDRANI